MATSASGFGVSDAGRAASPAKIRKTDEATTGAAPLGVAAENGSLKPAAAASTKSENQSYPIGDDKFPIADKQVQSAREIIKTLADASTFELLKEDVQAGLKAKGNELDKVHPLCLLWALFGHSETKARLVVLTEKTIVPGTSIWDIVLGYSNFVAEEEGSEKKGYGLSLEKFYGGKSLEEVKGDFDAFYEALRLNPDVMNPLLLEALKTLPEEAPKEELQAASGWGGLGSLFGKAKKMVSRALTIGAWDDFLRALLNESSYIKVKKD